MIQRLISWIRPGRSGTGENDEDEGDSERSDDGSVWDLIPSRQYGGRHVESGGLTRDEQESALDDINQQAQALEQHDDVHNRRK